LHRPCRRIAQRTDGAAGDVVAQIEQQVQVFRTTFAVLDAVDNAIQPTRALAAGGALTATLVLIELG
jgi:hypothetical protein